MTDSAWENGSRVPVAMPEVYEDNETVKRPDNNAAAIIRRLVGILLADSNPALGVECLAVITGIGYRGDSFEEIAKRHGVSRQAVSKRCVELTDTFGIEPVRAMRRKSSRDKCRESRIKSAYQS